MRDPKHPPIRFSRAGCLINAHNYVVLYLEEPSAYFQKSTSASGAVTHGYSLPVREGYMQLTAKRGRKEVHPFLEISCRKRVVDTGLFRDEDSERAVQRGVFS